MTISPERLAEWAEINEISRAANAYIWGVWSRSKPTYTPREKWDLDSVKTYLKDYCHMRQRFDEELERWLTKEDKKAIDAVIKRRLEIIITGQQEVGC